MYIWMIKSFKKTNIVKKFLRVFANMRVMYEMYGNRLLRKMQRQKRNARY